MEAGMTVGPRGQSHDPGSRGQTYGNQPPGHREPNVYGQQGHPQPGYGQPAYGQQRRPGYGSPGQPGYPPQAPTPQVYGQPGPRGPERPAGGDGNGPRGPKRPGGASGGSTGPKGSKGPNRAAKPGAKGKSTGRKSPLWTKLVLSIGVLVVLGGAGGIVAMNYVLGQVNTAIAQTDLLGNDVAKGNSVKGAINILLVGLDTRPDNTIGSRSDSIIIAHVPASHDRVYLVSIPRDTDAYIPPDKATGFTGGDWKINAAFEFGSQHKGGQAGGFSLLAQTIKMDYGITFNGGAIVDFDGFTDIVNKLGGVDMYVDETTRSIHHGYLVNNPSQTAVPYKLDPNCGCPIHGFDDHLPGTMEVIYQKGFQHLSAYQALDYVRIRDGLPYTDYDRQRHQQQFLKALIKEMSDKGLTDPTKLPGFLNSLGKAINFDRGGISLTDWIFTLKGITPASIMTIKINDGMYDKYTGPAPDSRQSLTPDSMDLLKDLQLDKIDSFVAQHPDWVATS
jgi:polyisoprenyl-teichoic acid--peptidoglycan teichoic acid transferase